MTKPTSGCHRLLYPLLLAALILLPTFGVTVAQDGGEPMTGSGMIECWLSTPAYTRECDPDRDPELRANLTVGEQERVTVTVDWTPVSQDARELRILLQGNVDCLETEGPRCSQDIVQGSPPLTATLTGAAASDTTMELWVRGPRICEKDPLAVSVTDWAESCETPLVRVILDQPFEYEWSLE